MALVTSAGDEVASRDELPSAADLPTHVTTYIGRGSEIREAIRLLETASLVTLTGPGGVGKSRLALQVAAEMTDRFPHGVVYVPLAELNEPDLLVSTIADRLGIGDQSARPALDVLCDHVSNRKLLLLMDNCEHLVDACARLLDTLVRTAPGLVVLATGRQSLGVEGERILPVPPLAIPERGEKASRLHHYDAVKLFIDRATAVVPSFTVTDENADDVADLCGQLDGLPLAIELAAVRLRALSVRQITERLSRQLTLLGKTGRYAGPSRHETLQALADWSYELCTEPERLLWSRLSVFSGGFDLTAAEEVCSGDGLDPNQVLDVIDGLIDKSILLREEQHGLVRYRILETLRQYGADQLLAAGDVLRMRRRHRDWYLRLTERFEQEWIGPDQLTWIARMKREHANLRAALDFCASDPDEAVSGLRMTHSFKEYWLIRGISTEGRIQLNRLLDIAPADAPGTADAYWNYAFLALVQGDMPAYERSIANAADAAAATDDEHARAYILHVQAYARLIGNEMPAAAELFGTAVEMFRDQGDLGGELWSRFNYGIATALAGELDLGRTILRECIDAYGSRGEVFWRSWAQWSLGAAEYLAGDLHLARQACDEVLRTQQLVGDRAIIAFALTVTAGCAAHSGQDHRAAKLFGAAATFWQSLGASPTHYAAFVDPIKRDTDAVTGRLGWDKAAAEFAAGYTMTSEEAIAYALDRGRPEQQQAASPDNPLTKRENEIADLVAKGMTSREIAQHLVIAQRTAETHVDHILTKLGFTRRAQIAAWVTDARRH